MALRFCMQKYKAAAFSQRGKGTMANMIVTGGSLNVRRKPDVRSQIVEVLPDGAKITVKKKVGEWYEIDPEHYVMAGYLVPAAVKTAAEKKPAAKKTAPKKAAPRKAKADETEKA